MKMSSANLEHVNVTVSDPAKTAAMLAGVFGWHTRWHGDAMNGGTTYHVGSDASYVALYSPAGSTDPAADSYVTRGGLNHVAVTVTDLDATEARVKAAGFAPQNHGDYEPGRRFISTTTTELNTRWSPTPEPPPVLRAPAFRTRRSCVCKGRGRG